MDTKKIIVKKCLFRLVLIYHVNYYRCRTSNPAFNLIQLNATVPVVTRVHTAPQTAAPVVTRVKTAPQTAAPDLCRVETAFHAAVRRNEAANIASQTSGALYLNRAVEKLDDAFSKLDLTTPALGPAPAPNSVNPDVMKVIPEIKKKMEQHRRDVMDAVSLMEILQAQGNTTTAARTGGDSGIGSKDPVRR